MENLTSIGTIRIDGQDDRYLIAWDGATLCDVDGVEIMDGAAATLEEAQELAAHLWEDASWDYQEAESSKEQ